MTHNDRLKLDDKSIWLGHMLNHVKPGRIVELGCGSGFVLEFLAKNFGDSLIVGLDVKPERLENVVEKGLRNVIPIQADITHKIFPVRSFNTVLLVGVLHEVFSNLGIERIEDTYRIAHDILRDDGTLIIQDFLKPPSRSVNIRFRCDEAHNKFIRFANEFRPREIEFMDIEHGVKLDIADAIEFISKYRSPNEEDWIEEMGETHFFFTEEDHRKMAQRTGFFIKDLTRLPKSENWRIEISKDIEFDHKTEYQWIQLVLEKNLG